MWGGGVWGCSKVKRQSLMVTLPKIFSHLVCDLIYVQLLRAVNILFDTCSNLGAHDILIM